MYAGSIEQPMKQVTTPQVILILGSAFIIMSAVVLLALFDKDVSAILQAVTTFAVVLLGGLGIHQSAKLDQVKDVANGRLTEIIEDNKRLNDKLTALALLVPNQQQFLNPPDQQ